MTASPSRSAFAAPGYVWLWASSLMTWMGWTVCTLGQGWLVLRLTDSPLWVGVAVGVRGITLTCCSPAGGALADRIDRRSVLRIVHALNALSTLAIAMITISGAVRLWHVLAFMGIMGLVSAMERPATIGLLYDVVGPGRLLNASALRFIGTSTVQIGAALSGGYIIGRLGVGHNFLLAAGGYLVALAAVSRLRPRARATPPAESFAKTLLSGLRYGAGVPIVSRLLVLSLAVETFGFSYLAMLPVVARDVLHVGSLGLGYLGAAGGLGQLTGSLFVASRGDVQDKTGLMVWAAVGFGVFVVLFGLSPWFPLSLALVFAAHIMGTTYDTGIYTLLPSVATEGMRGRATGLMASTLGFNQVGGIGVGALAAAVGVPAAIAVAGGLTAAIAVGSLPGLRRTLPHVVKQDAPA